MEFDNIKNVSFVDFKKNKHYITLPDQYKAFEKEKDVEIVSFEEAKKILKKLPLNISYISDILLKDRLAHKLHQSKVSVAVLGGGGGFGDILMIQSILIFLYKELKKFFSEVQITLYALRPSRYVEIASLYGEDFNVLSLPVSLKELEKYDLMIDYTGFASYLERVNLSFKEFFSLHLGITNINDKLLGRIIIPVYKSVEIEIGDYMKNLKRSYKKLLLFHPNASTPMRSIPSFFQEKLLRFILDNTDYTVISAVPLSFKHKKVLDLSKLSKSINHLIYIVSFADAVISAETVVFHIADAFNIPTLVLTTTKHGYNQAKNYPTVKAILLGKEVKDNPIINLHFSDKPEHLEFLENLWKNTDPKEIVSTLENWVKKCKKNRKELYKPNYEYISYILNNKYGDKVITIFINPSHKGFEESLLSILGQDYDNFSIVVVDKENNYTVRETIKKYKSKVDIHYVNEIEEIKELVSGSKYVKIISENTKLYPWAFKHYLKNFHKKGFNFIFSAYNFLIGNEFNTRRFYDFKYPDGDKGLYFIGKEILIPTIFMFKSEILMKSDIDLLFKDSILWLYRLIYNEIKEESIKLGYIDVPTCLVYKDRVIPLNYESLDNELYRFFKSLDFEKAFPTLSRKDIAKMITSYVKRGIKINLNLPYTFSFLLNHAQKLYHVPSVENLIQRIVESSN